MQKFNCKIEKPASPREKLPAGAYIAKILGAKVIENDYGSQNLVIRFDILEGGYKGFFQKDYDECPYENKKWRGIYRLPVPKDESEKEAWKARAFGNGIWAIEASNNGYHWDWDEKTLKNKLVGVLFRNKEWEMNGNYGWTTECGALADVEDVRAGKCKPLKDKALDHAPQGFAQLGDSPFPNVQPDDDDDPFL